MSRRNTLLAGVFSTSISLLAAVAGTAHAATATAATSGRTWYVAGNISASGPGTGTVDDPFIFLQDAVDAAGPGDTINVVTSPVVGPVVITKSNLTIVGAPGRAGVRSNIAKPAIVVSGASNVRISNLLLRAGLINTPAVQIIGSNSVTLDSDTFLSAAGSDPTLVTVDGSSSDITVSRSLVNGTTTSTSAPANGTGIALAAGAKNITLASNIFGSGQGTSIRASGIQGLNVVGNTVQRGCGGALSIAGSSGAVVIKNNVFEDAVSYSNGGKGSCGSVWGADVTVDSTSSGGTVAGSNTFWVNGTNGTALYNWNGADYPALDKFRTDSGQGARDTVEAQPLGQTTYGGLGTVNALPLWNTSVMGSADPAAPGAVTTDMWGVTPYTERGALAYVDQLSVGFQVTAQGAKSALPAPNYLMSSSSGIVSYDIDWGDGSRHQPSPTFPGVHTFPNAGTYSVTLTVTDAAGKSVQSAPVPVTTLGSEFVPVSPVRIVDSRDGTGLTTGTQPLFDNYPLRSYVAGKNGVPADATAVAVNVTVTNNQSGDGAVGVTPGGVRLSTSNLNYAAGQTVANLVVVPIAADGSIDFTKLGDGHTDVIADLTGYYVKHQAQGFAPVDPYRALDTRSKTGWSGGRLATGKPIRLKVTGAGGVPATGVTAVAVNLTATDTSGGGGVIAAGPAGFTAGKDNWTSNLNYGDGQTIANAAVVPVDADGYIDLVNQGPGSASVVLDVNGYYSATADSAYLPMTPWRQVDTRSDGSGPVSPQSGASYTLALDANRNVDPNITSMVTNVTVANTSAGGFLTVYPSGVMPGGAIPPNASNLNWGPGQIVPNLTFARPGLGGRVSLFNGTPNRYPGRIGWIDLVVDVFGEYSRF